MRVPGLIDMFVSLSVAVIRFLSRRISRRQQHRWAPFVARCLARLTKRRVRTITRNISWCFPHDSIDQRRLLCQSVLTGTGLSVFDTLVAWFWTSVQIKRHIPHRIIGLNALLAVQKSGDRGVLLLAKHSQHIELDARLVGMHMRACGVARESQSAFVGAMMASGRGQCFEMSLRTNPRQFITWLKDKRTVFYYPDQDYGKNRSIETTWFGVPAQFTTAPYTLQKLTGCWVYFMNSYYEGAELVIEIERLRLPNESVHAFTVSLAQYIEKLIARHPGEYMWGHQRFKSSLGVEWYA